MRKLAPALPFLGILTIGLLLADSAKAATLVCIGRNGALALRSKCKKGETNIRNRSQLLGAAGPAGTTGATGSAGAAGSAGPQGAPGAAGASGADGSLRKYGDASKGDVTVSAGASNLFGADLDYHDLTIPAGATVTVASGTIIRCSGNFLNQGTINVRNFSRGGFMDINFPYPGRVDAGPGLGYQSAGTGQIAAAGIAVIGAQGSFGISSDDAKTILHPGSVGGGGGGGSFGGDGGDGGGTLTILAAGSITNSGLINAGGLNTPEPGAGGGGGGIIILASGTDVLNSSSGTLYVAGGNGGPSGSNSGGGGGGGGGLLYLIGRSTAVNSGTVFVNGGTKGSNAVAVNGPGSIQGGSAGGNSVGVGGFGSDVDGTGLSFGNSNGDAGQTLTLVADPATVL